jgi:hypothetical protein
MNKIKVKIFPNGNGPMLLQDIEAMEEEINKFIEENDIEVIDIKFTGTKGYIHALVIYKDKN